MSTIIFSDLSWRFTIHQIELTCRHIVGADAILSMQDIGSEESDDLARIIHPVLADAVPAVSKGARAADDAGALHDSTQAAVEVASPELLKLKVEM